MGLSLDIGLSRGDFTLEAALDVAPDEVVAVVGPNGAGKSTLLRAVAGLEAIDRGRITLDGQVLDDPALGRHLPTDRRRVGLVFQDYLLFPHMTAGKNIEFGAADAESARDWIDRLGLGDLSHRRPGELSGGEAQRVALARTLAARPRVLLLDEPLAALDVESRNAVRTLLGRHLPSIPVPVVLVTHDPIDAGFLADRLVVLEDGSITQSGDLADVTRRPRTDWAARLGGVNLYRGKGAGTTVEIDGARLVLADRVEGEVFVAVQPRAVSLHRRPPGGSPRNVWPGKVTGIEPFGTRLRVAVTGDLPIVAEITPEAAVALDLARLGAVWVVIKAAEIEAYPA